MKHLVFAMIAGITQAAHAAPNAKPEQACAELTGLQKAAGMVNFFTLFEILAFLAICWSLKILFPSALLALRRWFARVPMVVYEISLYLASFGFALTGWLLPDKPFEWGLAGALLLPGAIMFSAKLRKWEGSPNNFFSTLSFAWTLLALLYQSQTLGFIAVAAFMARMGFDIGIGRLCYAIGFTGRNVIVKASLVAFIVLSIFVGLHIAQWQVPYLDVFTTGGMWLGSVVFFSGLLIMSSKWQMPGAAYWPMQVITIFACIAAVAIGNLWQLGVLRGIGGTIFVCYLLEKPFEIPFAKRQSYAALALLMSLLVIGAIYWAKQHMALLTPYLLF